MRPAGDGRGLRGVPAALGVVGRREAHQQRHRLADLGAHRPHDVEQQPSAVLERAAVLVAARCSTAARGTGAAGSRARRAARRGRSRRRERGARPRRRRRRRAGSLVRGERARGAVALEGEVGGRDRLPAAAGSTSIRRVERDAALLRRIPTPGRSMPCVRRGRAGVRRRRPARARSRRRGASRPPARRSRCRCRAARSGPRATTAVASAMISPAPPDGERAEVREVPVGRHAVARQRRVLAERRHPDPVAHGDVAQGDRVEQGGHEALSAGTPGSRATRRRW